MLDRIPLELVQAAVSPYLTRSGTGALATTSKTCRSSCVDALLYWQTVRAAAAVSHAGTAVPTWQVNAVVDEMVRQEAVRGHRLVIGGQEPAERLLASMAEKVIMESVRQFPKTAENARRLLLCFQRRGLIRPNRTGRAPDEFLERSARFFHRVYTRRYPNTTDTKLTLLLSPAAPYAAVLSGTSV